MHFNTFVAIVAFAASAQAIKFPSFIFSRRGYYGTATRAAGTCPQVWQDISGELTALFLGSDGQCNDAARAAIRATFHDCFPDGGCDGSLSFEEEISRPANVPMTSAVAAMKDLAVKYNVTVADMLAFGGSHAIATCPSGPIVQTLIGRTDATEPCPDGQLPPAAIAGDAAKDLFATRGFDAKDLAALIGAHTVSKQFAVNPAQAGASQDTTPGIWDILYYVQTFAKTAPFTFVADFNLANQNEVGPWMEKFSDDKASWDAAFVSAMARMELLGSSDPSQMVDCTSALPQFHQKSRRDQKSANIFARLR